MDKTWVKLPRNNTEYKIGFQNFIRNSLNVASHEGKIKCPCQICANRGWRSPGTVYKHMQAECMYPDYEDALWHEHGEDYPTSPPPPPPVFLDDLERVRLDGFGETCAICLECYDDDDDEPVVTRLPCSHYFHGDCILLWLHIHPPPPPVFLDDLERVRLDGFGEINLCHLFGVL
ncbi:hypothetical protein ACLB2K_016150 [Fragaria x ananassa]